MLVLSYVVNMTTIWHTRYCRLSNEPAVRQFFDGALADAIKWLGYPRLPIKTVHLRLSRKLDPSDNIKEHFQLCELVSEQNGEFAIYTSKDSSDPLFHGQFAHEIAHLLDPQFSDAYVEGLNTLFAEWVVNKYGFEWSSWASRYTNGGDPFYAHTYHMLKDISDSIGRASLKNMLQFSENVLDSNKRRIAIYRWLDTLCDSQRRSVIDIIQNYLPDIRATRHEAVSTTQWPTQPNAT
jgi:hypothetical protein